MWYHGDWASVDEDGHWFLHGRADESMNVAGRKVGPAEVEEAMMQHPGVAEAAVIGVPDEMKGEAIVGYAVAKPGVALDPAARLRDGGGGARADVPAARGHGRRGVAENAERQDRAPADPPEIPRRAARRPFDGGESLGAVSRERACDNRSGSCGTVGNSSAALLARRIRYKVTRGGVLFHLRHPGGGPRRGRLRQ